MDEQTEHDLITGHPFQGSGRWGDICEHEAGGWICGYSRAEHAARLEGATEEVTPDETP